MLSNLNHQPTTAAPTVADIQAATVDERRNRGRRWLRLALIALLVLLTGFIVNLLLTNLVFTGLPTGTPAPRFQGNTLDGQPIDLAEQRGQPVMLTFWSPDCFACREELPALQALATDPNAELQLITVVSHMEPAAVEEFVEQEQLTFPVLVDPTGTIAQQYAVSGIPFTYLIDQNGVIDEVVMGAGQEGELHRQLATWLNSCRIDTVCAVE